MPVNSQVYEFLLLVFSLFKLVLFGVHNPYQNFMDYIPSRTPQRSKDQMQIVIQTKLHLFHFDQANFKRRRGSSLPSSQPIGKVRQDLAV
jgi:hypothetical protein